jgi:hypothetical protein
MKITIHQPNLMPWMPFFEKIAQADIFVILGQCDFEKNNFQNRFKYRDQWNTLSVESARKKIVDKQYTNIQHDWDKMKKRIDHRPLRIFDHCISNSVFQTNVGIIKLCCKLLKIDTHIVVDQPTTKTSTERLIEICQTHSCTTYLSGPSGRNYLDLDRFAFNGIEVEFFEAKNKTHTLDQPAIINIQTG